MAGEYKEGKMLMYTCIPSSCAEDSRASMFHHGAVRLRHGLYKLKRAEDRREACCKGEEIIFTC